MLITDKWFILTKICEGDYDKVRKFKRIRKLMCGRESLLVLYYLLGSFNSLILSFFILSLCVCEVEKTLYFCEKEIQTIDYG